MTTSLFSSELRRARESLGWSREQLAESMKFSLSLIEKVEAGSKPPSEDFARKADETLKTDGLLWRIRQHGLRQDAVPEWFRSWSDIEEQTAVLRVYNPLVVPGIVQTDDYARAQFQSNDPERAESRVAARMERQRELFERDSPPRVVVLLDESVLRRCLGSPEVMHQQLTHLTTCPAMVQVVPAGAETCLGLDGAFEIATVDGRDVAYAETPLRGFVLDSSEVVSQARERWEALRAEALPQRQSKKLILEVAESWKS